MNNLRASDCGELLVEIKQRIHAAQYEALKAVNRELIALYWDIGQLLVTRQQGETWGKSKTYLKIYKLNFQGYQGFPLLIFGG
jgi:hypothetical protein